MQSWKRFEYRVRDFLQKKGYNAERVPLSGSARAVKGDIIANKRGIKLRIDAKSTKSTEYIKLKRHSLEKIASEAEEDEIPLVVFSFYRHRVLYAVISSELAAHEPKSIKNTWARDTIVIKKSDLGDLPVELKFRDSEERYLIFRLNDLLERLNSLIQ